MDVTQNNPTAKHRAVIFLRAEVHELLNTGECTGNSVKNVDNMILAIDGNNKLEAIDKLEKIIKELKAKCQI